MSIITQLREMTQTANWQVLIYIVIQQPESICRVVAFVSQYRYISMYRYTPIRFKNICSID